MDYPIQGGILPWKALCAFVFYGSGISDDVYENIASGKVCFVKLSPAAIYCVWEGDTKLKLRHAAKQTYFVFTYGKITYFDGKGLSVKYVLSGSKGKIFQTLTNNGVSTENALNFNVEYVL
ncbi:hypothetical protein AVEN_118008-1 [Araneus ventricosus]|uniref:Uncharacterized protein n=1 Tax=Araneus ventricosus TaxID=182803 RepID=A0A4Y2CAE3_ARAVE|nr:hypothetical protein AVEN_118008-1 [Araneus ventricosus]